MPSIWILVLTTLVQDVGYVTTRTEYAPGNNKSGLENCLDAQKMKTMQAGDRMRHAHCEPK
jgi:hypothetical protein